MRWDASVAMYPPASAPGFVWFQESPAMSDDQFDDALLITPAPPEIIAKGLEADGYQLGISAFPGAIASPMERVVRSYADVSSNVPATSYRAPVNTIVWARP